MNAAPSGDPRVQLLERCQQERNELIAMTAETLARIPRARAWTRAAHTVLRLLRLLSMRAAAANPRS